MKKLIKEARRMQQLAGILKESQKPEEEIQERSITEEDLLRWLESVNPKAVEEIQDIDTSEYDTPDLVNAYNEILTRYGASATVIDMKMDNYGGIESLTIEDNFDEDSEEKGDWYEGMGHDTISENADYVHKVDTVINKHTPTLLAALKARKKYPESKDAHDAVESELVAIAGKLGLDTSIPYMEDEMFSGKVPAMAAINYAKEMFTDMLTDN